MSSNGGGLTYISHQNIDYGKWDNCIENAGNSRVYAMSWHLDRTAEVWDALVLGDYHYVMPLPVRKKWGLKYLYQPLFSQQLGIFPSPPDEVAQLFYAKTATLFRFSDVQINAQNQPFAKHSMEFIFRRNYLLKLEENYTKISAGYSKNTKRNIRKSAQQNLHYVAGLQIEDYLQFKQENLLGNISNKDFIKLKSIVAFGQYKGIGEISGVYNSDNKLCAAVYFCRWKERFIYFNAATNQQGKETGAMFYLVDQFIKNAAGTGMVLDFEGSMIPGVARFFAGFGAEPEIYHQLKINRLPLPLKWLKQKMG